MAPQGSMFSANEEGFRLVGQAGSFAGTRPANDVQSALPGVEARVDNAAMLEARVNELAARAARGGGLAAYNEVRQAHGFAPVRSAAEQIEPAPTPARDDAPPTKPYTIEEHKATMRRLHAGELSVEAYRAAFDRLLASEAPFKAEMSKLPKSKLTSDPWVQRWDKDQVVRAVFNRMLEHYLLRRRGERATSYQILSGETHQQALRARIYKVTAQDLADHVQALAEEKERAAAERERSIAEREERKRRAADPQTLEDFRIREIELPDQPLTNEQRRRFEALKAEAELAEQAKRRGPETIRAVQLGAAGWSIVQGWNFKKGAPVSIVTREQRLETDDYRRVDAIAGKLGGGYSRFKKRDGDKVAVPGWVFADADSAAKFVAAVTGEADVDNAAEVEARANRRAEATAERLEEIAARGQAEAAGELGKSRLANTARRAGMAASAEASARAELRLNEALGRVAARIASGEAKYLRGLKHRTQLEALERVLTRAIYERQRQDPENKDSTPRLTDVDLTEYPYPLVHLSDALRLVDKAKKTTGYKRDAVAFEKVLKRLQADEKVRQRSWSEVRDGKEIELWRKLSELSEAPKHWRDLDYERLQSMGLTSLELVREALREYLGCCFGQVQKADPIREAERALIGREWAGYFPTPRDLADHVAELAGVAPGQSVLEPSAGKGDLADAVRRAVPGVHVDVIEPVEDLRAVLQAKGYHLVGRDFLKAEAMFDRIVMNPPFEHAVDIDHVRHAYALLNPGGRLVAIMSEGSFNETEQPTRALQRKRSDFVAWLRQVGGRVEKNPEGAFLKSDRPTGVATRTVVIDKPAGPSGEAAMVPPAATSPTEPTTEEGCGCAHASEVPEPASAVDLVDLVVRAAHDAGLAGKDLNSGQAVATLGSRDAELVSLWANVAEAARFERSGRPKGDKDFRAWGEMYRRGRAAGRAGYHPQPAEAVAHAAAAARELRVPLSGKFVQLYLAAHRAGLAERRVREQPRKVRTPELLSDHVLSNAATGAEWPDAEIERRSAEYARRLAALGPLELQQLGQAAWRNRFAVRAVDFGGVGEDVGPILQRALTAEHARRGVGLPGSPEARAALVRQAGTALAPEKGWIVEQVQQLRGRILAVMPRAERRELPGVGIAVDDRKVLAGLLEELPTEADVLARDVPTLRSGIEYLGGRLVEIERRYPEETTMGAKKSTSNGSTAKKAEAEAKAAAKKADMEAKAAAVAAEKARKKAERDAAKAEKQQTREAKMAAKTAERDAAKAEKTAASKKAEAVEARKRERQQERERKKAEKAAERERARQARGGESDAKARKDAAHLAKQQATAEKREKKERERLDKIAAAERRREEREARKFAAANQNRPLVAHPTTVDPLTEMYAPPGALGAEMREGLVTVVRTPTGRVTVPVDVRDIDAPASRFVIPPGKSGKYRELAARQGQEEEQRRRERTRRAVSAFKSTDKAVREYMRNNGLYQVGSLELADAEAAREWMSTVEVRRGKSHRTLADTDVGRRLLNIWRIGPRRGAEAVLRYLFGKARNWSAVPWGEVDRFERQLAAAVGRAAASKGRTVDVTVEWRPVALAGELPAPGEYNKLAPEFQEAARDSFHAKRFHEAAKRSRDAARSNAACLSSAARRMVGLRIKTFDKYASEPWRAPEQLCSPDPRYGNTVCTLDPLETYLRELEVCCKQGTCDDVVAARWLHDAHAAGVPTSAPPSDLIPF